jgi:nucleotide-binding universal stress UspA family protein
MAVDDSEHARNAFEWFLSNLWRADDLIVLVHCPEAPKLPTFTLKSGLAPPVDEWKRILDEMNAKARKLEEDFEGTCALKKLKFKMRTEAMKNIGEGILRIAEEETADVIVCGAKMATGKNAYKGTTCDYIMRNSATPVVIIPLKY